MRDQLGVASIQCFQAPTSLASAPVGDIYGVYKHQIAYASLVVAQLSLSRSCHFRWAYLVSKAFFRLACS